MKQNNAALEDDPNDDAEARQAYLNAKAGKGRSPIFQTVEEGKRWLTNQRRIDPERR